MLNSTILLLGARGFDRVLADLPNPTVGARGYDRGPTEVPSLPYK